MTLEKQNVAIQFRGGVNTKDDPFSVPPGKLLLLENATFQNPGRLNKRNGYVALSREVENYVEGDVPANLSNAQGLVTYKRELLAFDKRNLYSRIDASKSYAWKGVLTSCRVDRNSVSSAPQTSSFVDGAQHSSGMQAVVWENSDGIRYSVIDSTTGQRVVASKLLVSGLAYQPRVVVANNTFVFYYVDSDNNLRAGMLPITEPTSVVDFDIVVTYSAGNEDSLNSSGFLDYDVATMSDGIYIAFNNDATTDGGGTLKKFTLNSPTNLVANVSWDDPAYPCTVFEDLTTQGPVVVFGSVAGSTYSVWMRAYAPEVTDGSGAPAIIAFALLDSPPAAVKYVTGTSNSAAERDLQFYWTIENFSASRAYTRTAGISGDYTVSAAGIALGVPWCEVTSAAEDFLRSVSLLADAFSYDGVAYVPVRYNGSVNQRTGFIADQHRNIVAKFMVGTAPVDDAGDTRLPSIFRPSSTTYGFASLESPLTSGTSTAKGATLSGLTFGVSNFTFDFFDRERSYLSSEIADSLFVGGGIVWQYDGVSAVESGFHVTPEPPAATPNGSAGTTYTYQYVIVPEWVDAQGYKQFGTPSTVTTYQQANPIASGETVSVVSETIRLTAKRDDMDPTVERQPIVLGIYRTKNNQTVFRRAGQVTNQTNVDTVTFTDDVTDAELDEESLLYTTGNVVENDAPPPANLNTVHRNRLFVVDSTNPLVVWYSKRVGPGIPVEFSAFFTFQVDPFGGPITGLASLDDKLVIFKRSSVFVVTGQGPDDVGQNNDFSDALLVTTDAGCINARSIVPTADGLLFQSTKGFYLLNRSLSLVDVGADVEEYANANVVGGALCEDVSQVRLTLDTGVTLVYDYFVSQWSVFTPQRGVDATVWKGTFCYLRADGTVLVETPGVFNDNGSFVKLRLKTSWMQFADMQGFQRIYKVMVLGTLKSPHTLRVKLAYDFNPTPSFTADVTPETNATYGALTYGQGVYGGTFPLYQWRVNPERQKCEAIQVTLEDVPEADQAKGESMTLSGLTFQIGQKGGVNRLPATHSVG